MAEQTTPTADQAARKESLADLFTFALGQNSVGAKTVTIIGQVSPNRAIPNGGIYAPKFLVEQMQKVSNGNLSIVEQREPRRVFYVMSQTSDTEKFARDLQRAGENYITAFGTSTLQVATMAEQAMQTAKQATLKEWRADLFSFFKGGSLLGDCISIVGQVSTSRAMPASGVRAPKVLIEQMKRISDGNLTIVEERGPPRRVYYVMPRTPKTEKFANALKTAGENYAEAFGISGPQAANETPEQSATHEVAENVATYKKMQAGAPRTVSPAVAPAAIPFHVLAERGLLWHGGFRVPLNVLDSRLTADVYDAYLRRQSRIFVYPIPCHVLPSLLVATMLVNTFGRCQDRARVPRLLFYTGIDGRDLYRELGVGVQCEKISETFGFTRLNSDGLPIESVKLTSQLPLVVTGHCVLPKDRGYRADIVVIDADAFDAKNLCALIEDAARRWPTACFYVVVSNPVSSVIGTSAKLGWGLIDLLHDRPMLDGEVVNDPEFANVSTQLKQLQVGIKYEAEIVAPVPAPSWRDLTDPLSLARKHRNTSRAARQFIAMTRLLTEMAVLPSEYDAYRTPNMLTLSERMQLIRDEARHEGRTAQLIASGCTVLSDVCAELEKRNWKRDALLESILEFCYSGRSAAIVVQRAGMRAVLAQSVQLFPECIDMLQQGRLRVLAASDVSHASSSDIVIVPGIFSVSEMSVLRTTIAPQMRFLCYSLELALQTWCLKELGLLDARESLVAGKAEGTSQEPETSQTDGFDIDLSDLLLSEDAGPEHVMLASAPIISGPRRQIWFEDGMCSIVPDAATLHVVVDTEEPIQSKRAKAIEPGDWLVMVNGDAQQSLFEALREHVDSKTSLSQAIDVVKAFQHALGGAYRAGGMTGEKLHAELVRLGSDIQHQTSVVQWVDGRRFGPSDAKDISRLGTALKIPLFETRYQDFYRAMQRVRVAHRELGRILVRVIKNAYKETDSKSVRLTVGGETVVLYDVLQAVTLKRVRQVKELK